MGCIIEIVMHDNYTNYVILNEYEGSHAIVEILRCTQNDKDYNHIMTMLETEVISMSEYVETTSSVTIRVNPVYLETESTPGEEHYVWVYHVKIENEGDNTVQLINRYWKIMDGEGRIQEVKGSGVVGQQPVMRPGESFEYASGTYLPTTSGMMSGFYEMKVIDEEVGSNNMFKAIVPTFSLDSDDQLNMPN